MLCWNQVDIFRLSVDCFCLNLICKDVQRELNFASIFFNAGLFCPKLFLPRLAKITLLFGAVGYVQLYQSSKYVVIFVITFSIKVMKSPEPGLPPLLHCNNYTYTIRFIDHSQYSMLVQYLAAASHIYVPHMSKWQCEIRKKLKLVSSVS